MHQVLTIAGLDSLAGGGATADIKTFEEFNVFGHVLLTSVVAIDQPILFHDLPLSVIQAQLDSLKKAVDFSAIKIGLIHQVPAIDLVKEFITEIDSPVILDPVLAFKEGDTQFNQAYQEGLIQLFPYSILVTPNLAEAEHFAAMPIHTVADMKLAAEKISHLGAKQVLIKGGSRIPGAFAYDVLYQQGTFTLLEAPKSTAQTTNGAGCTLSAAIAALCGQGIPLEEAVHRAKAFVLAGIDAGISLNNQEGIVNQLAYFRKEYTQ